jgi:hypothetical protein
MVGKSRWFRRLKHFPVSRRPARKVSGLSFGGSGFLVLALLLLILTLAAGCSRPSDLPDDEAANKADQHKLPFQDSATKGNEGSNSGVGNSGEAKADLASNGDPRTASGPPFQTSSSVPELPPGMLLTVRVEAPISNDRLGDDRTGEEGTFAGVVDEPVITDGKIAVPRGATVTGRIEAARAYDGAHGRGYIRLTLDTITIAGKTLPLRTSSLFVRGGEVRGGTGGVVSPDKDEKDEAEQAHPIVTRLQKGRRLTFRLAATGLGERQETVSSSQNHPTRTE